MTKKNTTKRALFASVLSLLLCVSMLIGSTFAWFTDTASTGVNTIQSGNLDIVLSYKNADQKTWKEVSEADKLFNDAALWEPGYTEVAYLKLENNGSLALKYQLTVNVLNEVAGTNKDGGTIKLSEVLKYDLIELASDTTYADRAAALAAVSDAKNLATEIVSGNMEADADAKYFALVVYMPTTVGNEANHNGTDKPSIQLGVNVLATQYTSESDSYGSDYDADAYFPLLANERRVNNDAELAAALADPQAEIIYLEVGEYSPFTVGRDNVTIKGVIGATKAESTVITNTVTDRIILGDSNEYAGTSGGQNILGSVNGVTLENLWIDSTVQPNMPNWGMNYAIVTVPYYEMVASYAVNTTITGCYFEGNGEHGVLNHFGDGLTFSNNTVKNFSSINYAESNLIKSHTISGNTIENVESALSYVMTNGGQADITITNNTVVDSTVFTLWDYAQWQNRNSTEEVTSGFANVTISGNNGAINYNLTHFDYKAKTPYSITLGTGAQKVNYINGVAFDIEYADRANYTITNTDGSALDKTTQGRDSLTVSINVNGVAKAACYELASGTYYLVNNETEEKHEFTVTEPVVGVQQYITFD